MIKARKSYCILCKLTTYHIQVDQEMTCNLCGHKWFIKVREGKNESKKSC